MKAILVASGEQDALHTINHCLKSEYEIDTSTSLEGCQENLRKRRYEFVLIDVALLGTSTLVDDYKKSLQLFWDVYPTMDIIVMSTQQMIRETVTAVKAGASNYLTYPIDTEELRLVTESLHESVRMESELEYLRDEFWQSDTLEVVTTRNPEMQRAFDKIRSVAPTSTSVLLAGETGTGKGVIAKLIHRHSHRKDRQFISIHCGAIPDTLLESELFGHEKGSFTGAHRRRLGKFEIANKGTIFLDEIATLTPSAQIKLLRVLQEKAFHRVGGEQDIEVDVRIIAATNTDLKEMNRQGNFRSDLFYRLSVFPIEVPPLRDRREDIPLLAQVFLKQLNQLYLKEIREIHPSALEALERYTWPGNIRELENIIERAYILESSSILTPESFPIELFESEAVAAPIPVDTSLTLSEVRRRCVENIERQYLKELFVLHKGRVNSTAAAAGITPRQLHKLMTKHRIRKEEYKLPRFQQPGKR